MKKGIGLMIIINIERDGIDLFNTIINNYPDNIEIDDVEFSFDGASILQICIDLTKFIVPIVASILISKTGKSKILSIKKNGVDINIPINKELNIEEVEALLQRYIDDEE